MPLIVPFAAPLAEAGRAALRSLPLPNLKTLLARSRVAARDEGDEWSWSTPHERALARAFGWAGGDGVLPWAARALARDGFAPGDLAWGLVTPAHWHLGTEQVSMADPAALVLAEADARALFDAAQPLFASEGFAVQWGAPTRWYVAHEALGGLRTASPDRAIGRNVDAWLGGGAGRAISLVRRIQNEVQMLWHTHPANEAREARGLLPVNSFWLSGCGAAQPADEAAARADERLRAHALAADWAGWARAWETLDEGPIAELVATRDDALVLAGERSSIRLEPVVGVLPRLRARLAAPAPLDLLEDL